MFTIFAVHESVEGERRLRAVRTDHDNFRCRALHPLLPAQDHPQAPSPFPFEKNFPQNR